MSDEPRAVYTRAPRRRRRRPAGAIGLIAALAFVAGFGLWLVAHDGGATEKRTADPTVRLTQAGREVLRLHKSEIDESTARSLRKRVKAAKPRRKDRRGRATVELKTDFRATARRLRAGARTGADTVAVVERPVAAIVEIPVVKQRLRNNCESSALAMLLDAGGRRVDQLALQRQLPRSGSLDPQTRPDGMMLWGDPRKGFVGRPDGGGTAGGYGVYEGPIAALARRRGIRPTDLSRRSATAVYSALREGRPVMTWVGLSDGPYQTWTTPAGDRFTGNFGEHTVVLTGIRGATLTVNDPLSGRQLQWSRSQFETMWARLGDRALAL